MKPTDFAYLLTRYLGQYLPGQRNLSPRTIESYRDTFKLLLHFVRTQRGWTAEQITMAHLDRACVEAFLDWLETSRHCGVVTRNQRLAALRAFFRWASYEAPDQLALAQRILAIPRKRTTTRTVAYLTPEALQILLAQPDRTTADGRRDAVLLAFLYDTGARVQEVVDVLVRDVRLAAPVVATLTGKGTKRRQVPLMRPTAALVAAYMEEHELQRPELSNRSLFCNRQRHKLTRWGVTYILQKYVAAARAQCPAGFPKAVTPHVLRHTKAMHLLQAGVNLIYIRDLLGHADVTTTEIYARADTEMKRRALETARIPGVTTTAQPWTEDANLMQWLQRLCVPSS
jgi:site-specific recombinase XerD